MCGGVSGLAGRQHLHIVLDGLSVTLQQPLVSQQTYWTLWTLHSVTVGHSSVLHCHRYNDSALILSLQCHWTVVATVTV